MHKFKNLKSKQAWMALKLDMGKAYYRIEWDFVIECFQELGFHSQMVRWLKRMHLNIIVLSSG